MRRTCCFFAFLGFRGEDFYGAALKGNWQFSESVAYLRELGALDEPLGGRSPGSLAAPGANEADSSVAGFLIALSILSGLELFLVWEEFGFSWFGVSASDNHGISLDDSFA